MRFTIERLRTLVLVAGVLLVIALGVFLGTARFRNRFNRRDLPQKLGLNIQEEANGFVYTHEVRGHMLYKIHASKQVQLKRDDKVFLQLHNVTIELYAEDGSRVDKIEGDEFEYDPNSGIARAVGPVEITLSKPKVAPAIAPKATANQALNTRQKDSPVTSAAQSAASGQIYVKTSGLIFDRNTGQASTEERVEFTLADGSGSAMGANYDSHNGLLVLDHAVQLDVQRGADPVNMLAQHAVFERENQVCELQTATVHYRADVSNAERAKVYFRDDGSAKQLQADGGFVLVTATGGRLAAPTGTLIFDEQSQPLRGHMQGGVSIDSDNKGRKVHGTSPTMELVFAGKGELRSAHLERGVHFVTDEETSSASGLLRAHRNWASPVADITFKDGGNGKAEPASIHGVGGVVVEATSQRGNGPVMPEKLTADDVTGEFGPNGTLTKLIGRGHTAIAETTATGTQQTMSGDLLDAHLAAESNANATSQAAPSESKARASEQMQIESATVDGNVVLTEQPPPKAGVVQAVLRATAGHADYDNAGQLLHLTRTPRVTDGGLELAADSLDVSQESGDAFAQGDVKATWTGDPERANSAKGGTAAKSNPNFGAQGPTHVVAEQAELKRSSGAATFRGNARLWQQGNSVVAPVIVLDRTKQTLTAETKDGKHPVQVVLVSATAAVPGKPGRLKQSGPSVIRVRGGDLKYSSAERRAVMRAGAAGNVVSTTADATTVSNELELILLPPGNHAGKDGAAAQVDRMTSTGHVEISSEGRRGVGEQLVYTSDTDNYVLTGTAAAPPRLTDPTRGMVTGQALIFNSRDDSVSIEGNGRKTTTVTTAPK
jgi:lipopolysaccharide export system protein LptA